MEMHGLMANHRIGMLTMKIVDYEVKRYDHREDERKAREEEYKAIIEEAKIAGDEQAAMQRVKRLRENAEVKQKLYTKKQEKMLFVAFYILMNLAEDIQVEKKMLNKGLLKVNSPPPPIYCNLCFACYYSAPVASMAMMSILTQFFLSTLFDHILSYYVSVTIPVPGIHAGER